MLHRSAAPRDAHPHIPTLPLLLALALLLTQPLQAAWAPKPHVADDTGNWTTSTFTELQIRLNGFTGYRTDGAFTSVGGKTHHPQHIVRLPNKVDGLGRTRAYFAITQSNRFYHATHPAEWVTDGYWMVVELDPDAYDPATDQVIDTPGSDGQYIYEEHFNDNRDSARDEYEDQLDAKPGRFVISPVGDWTHPAKMSAFGGVMLMVGQNWSPLGTVGDSPDAVLFYDVRDPVNPVYLGMLDVHDLGIVGGEIDAIALAHFENGYYHLGVQQQSFLCHEVLDCFIDPVMGTKWGVNEKYPGQTELDLNPNAGGQQGDLFHSREIYGEVPAADELCYDASGAPHSYPEFKPAECAPAGTYRAIFFEAEEDSVLPNNFFLPCDLFGEFCGQASANREGIPGFATLVYNNREFNDTQTFLEARGLHSYAGRFKNGRKNTFVTQLTGHCAPNAGIYVNEQRVPLVYCMSESDNEPLDCPDAPTGGSELFPIYEQCNRIWENAANAAPSFGAIKFTDTNGRSVTYRGRGLPDAAMLNDPPWGPGPGHGIDWKTANIAHIEVLEGDWLLYDSPWYEGPGLVREVSPGTYTDNLGALDSFRVIPADGITLFEHGNRFGRMLNNVRSNPSLFKACGDTPEVCFGLARDENCDWDDEIENIFDGDECKLPRTFNDKASAMLVRGNMWSFYNDGSYDGGDGVFTHFHKHTRSLGGVLLNEPGEVRNLHDYGFGDIATSLKAMCETPLAPTGLSATIELDNRPLLIWTSLGEDIEYDIEVRDASGQPLLFDGRHDPRYMPAEALAPGDYTLAVRGVNKQDYCVHPGPWSAPLAVTIAAPPPPNLQLVITPESTDQFGLGSGSIAVSPAPVSTVGGDYYAPGTVVTLTATPTNRAEFVGWGGTVSSCGASPSCEVTIAEGMVITPIFRPKPTLRVDFQGNGTVARAPLGDGCAAGAFQCEVYSTGTEVTLTATAGNLASFSHWAGDPDCADGSVTVDASMSCTAVFSRTDYQLSVSGSGASIASDPPGAIDCGIDCSETYPVAGGQQTVILNASVDPGFVFVRWFGDQDCWDEDESDGDPLRISVTTGSTDVDCSAMAVPAGTEYALTVEKTAGGHGTVMATATPAADASGLDCPLAACSQSFTVNSQITLTATPNRGSVFAGWDGDADCVDGLVEMTNNVSCSARFTDKILLVDGSDDGNKRSEYTAVFSNIEGSDVDEWSVQSPNSTSNPEGRVEPLASDLAPYSRVVWYSGNASADRDPSPAAGPSGAAETELGSWLDAGGCLLLSSPQYHVDRGITPFAQNYLGVASVVDDIAENGVSGAGHPQLGFSNLGPYLFNFSSAGLLSTTSDALVRDSGTPGSDALLAYSGEGEAGVAADNGTWRTAFLGFPFLALQSGNDRIEVMAAFLDYCQQPDFDDALEPNDDFASASERQGEISIPNLVLLPGDEDYYRWVAEEYRDTRFSIDYDDADGTLAIDVYDASLALIASAARAAASAEVTVSGVDAGAVYYARVFAPGGGGNRYALNIAATGPADHDHDGTPDADDAFPEDASEQADADGDLIGDNADTDDDNDGMSDDFENAHGLDPESPADASQDADGDGFSNLEEADAGTDPRDDASIPAVPETTTVAVPPPQTGGDSTGGGGGGGGGPTGIASLLLLLAGCLWRRAGQARKGHV